MSIASYIKGHMGLRYKPANIDADAAAILTSATKAVKLILDRRAALDRQGLQDQPLIVLMGENHAQISHQVHHMLVTSKLGQEESAAIAFEHDHDFLARYYGRDFSEHELKYVRYLDQSGRASLKSLMSVAGVTQAAHSRFVFQTIVLKSKLPVRFIDATHKNQVLNQNDPSTAKSIKACLPDTEKERKFSNAESMWVRNHHMTEMAVDFAGAARRRILLINCGAAHIFGDTRANIVERSLSAMFKQRGYPQFALPLSYPAAWPLPKDHGLAEDEFLECRELPDVTAVYSSVTGKPRFRSFFYDIQNREAEAGYLRSVMERVGLGDSFISVAVCKGMESVYMNELVEMAAVAQQAAKRNFELK